MQQHYQTAISDPRCQDPEFLAAIDGNAELKATRDQQIKLDTLLLGAFEQTPAPSKQHLELVKTISQQSNKETKVVSTKGYLALAASVILSVVGVGWLNLSSSENLNLTQHVLDHSSHGHHYAGVTNTHPSTENVNAMLAQYNVSMSNTDNIIWKKECDYQGITSAHLVYQHHENRVNVYLVPDSYDFNQIANSFSDQQYQGTIKHLNNHYLVIVAPKEVDTRDIESQLNKNLQWKI